MHGMVMRRLTTEYFPPVKIAVTATCGARERVLMLLIFNNVVVVVDVVVGSGATWHELAAAVVSVAT